MDAAILAKVRHTLPQAKIGRRQTRLRNLDDAFAAAPNTQHAQPLIVLIDDVSTTGATMEAARKALKKAGYGKVIAITAAH